MEMQVQGRNKKPARFYYAFVTFLFMVLFLDSVISLGAFGVVQQRLHSFNPQYSQCILFGSPDSTFDAVIHLPNVGACAFILWGQVSIVIISFVWIVFNVFQAVVAPRILSVLRILDFLVMGLSFLLSFALSITITAGLKKTCSAILGHFPEELCSITYVYKLDDFDERLYYYNGVYTSQNSSWVASMMFLGLMVFNLILMILFFLGKKNRRSEPILTRLHDEDEVTFQTASSLEPEELGDVTEEKKIPTPFK